MSARNAETVRERADEETDRAAQSVRIVRAAKKMRTVRAKSRAKMKTARERTAQRNGIRIESPRAARKKDSPRNRAASARIKTRSSIGTRDRRIGDPVRKAAKVRSLPESKTEIAEIVPLGIEIETAKTRMVRRVARKVQRNDFEGEGEVG